MKLNQDKDKYVLTEKEKRALVWRIERYKQNDLNYLPLNYKISQEMKEILNFVEDLANSAREIQQYISIAAMQEADTIQKRTTIKMKNKKKKNMPEAD